MKNFMRWDNDVYDVDIDSLHPTQPLNIMLAIDHLLWTIDVGWARVVPYHEYLHSDWWQTVRRQRLDYAGHRCEWNYWDGSGRCEATDQLNVHHLTYERLGEEDWRTDLIVFCRPHHEAWHRLHGEIR